MHLNFSYPKKNSLAGRVVARLLRGQIVDHHIIDLSIGSYRLAAYIHYLRKRHRWDIYSMELKKNTKDPVQRNATYTTYALTDECIEWAGTEGQAYADEVLGIENERINRSIEPRNLITD
ncbi:MAG: hypothetical protein V4629_02460 [Pseudomonadota bacterium]